jgi:hypothetical protein
MQLLHYKAFMKIIVMHMTLGYAAKRGVVKRSGQGIVIGN